MFTPLQHARQSIADERTGRWVIVNGDLVDFDHAHVSAFDRSFLYGDGVYTTLKVKEGKPVFLARHLARLRRHMDRLMFGGCGFDFDLPDTIRKLIVSNAIVDGCVRVTVSRGTQDPFSLAKRNSLPAIPLSVTAVFRDGTTRKFTIFAGERPIANKAQLGATDISD